jgi:nucleoside-diphosphate-sugar epimerase
LIYVVGGRGLVGSAFVRFLDKEKVPCRVIDRQNRDQFWGTSCSTLIYANGNAIKFKANEDPFTDFVDSVSSAAEYVHRIGYQRFVHISSADVYDRPSSKEHTREDTEIDWARLPPYGYHKWLAEHYVRRFAKKYTICRLAGVLGKGLKKNPLYDYLHRERLVRISPDSYLNFIHADSMVKVVWEMLGRIPGDCETYNVAASQGIRIGDLLRVVGRDSAYVDSAGDHVQSYHISIDKLQKYVRMPTSEEAILQYLREDAEEWLR